MIQQPNNPSPSASDDETPVGLVSQVAEKLLAMGFIIVTARFGRAPCITVKASHATRHLDSHYKGQGFDGRYHYRTYVALVDGVQVEWHKPHPVLKIVH